ncbi:MAG: MarR family transcriptional regulator [Bacillota bacterium]
MEIQDMIKERKAFFKKHGMSHPKKRMLHMIRRIHDKMEKDGNAKLKEIDLTLAQGHVLGFLLANDGKAPLKDLEKALNVAQSTSAGLVSRLEKRGYIENSTDQADKRIKIVSITQSGLDAMNYIGETMRGLEEQIKSPLSEEESELFTNLLSKIVSGMDNRNCT